MSAPNWQNSRKRQRRAGTLCLSASVFALTFGTTGDFGDKGITFHSPAALAYQNEKDVFGDLAPLDADALEDQRGGFKVAGLDINVGISVSSSIDGFVQVVSSFSVSELGKITNLGTKVTTHPNVQMPDVSAIVDDQLAAAKPADIMPDVSTMVDEQLAAANSIVQGATTASTDGIKSGNSPEISDISAAADQIVPVQVAPAVEAVDMALGVFNIPEVLESADITQSTVNDPPANSPITGKTTNSVPASSPIAASTSTLPVDPITTDVMPVQTVTPASDISTNIKEDIDTKIEAVTKSIPNAVSVSNSSEPPASEIAEIRPVAGHDGTKLTAAGAAPSGQAASPQSSPQDAHAVVSTNGNPESVMVETKARAEDKPDLGKNVAEVSNLPSEQQPAEQSLIATSKDIAKITHKAENGHLSIVENTVNNVSIRQTVSINLTIENFKHSQSINEIRSNMASVARQIGILSLRR